MNENYSIVRADRAGVFFGIVKENKGTSVIMRDVRKIYYWEGAAAVEQMSQDGIGKKSKCTVMVPEMEILNPVQIIPCSEKATLNIKNQPVWKM